jgi:D-3-phosphoglycerate dehydrogenase
MILSNRKSIRLLIAEPDNFSPDAVRILTEFADVELKAISQAEVSGALSSYDAIWLRLGLTIRAADLHDKIRCRWLVTATTGTDHIDIIAAEEMGICVLSLKGQTEFLKTIHATAEHTVALILSLIRLLPWAFDDTRKGNWDRDNFKGFELQGKIAGIVGLGRLGRIVARYLKVFDMRVLAYDPYVKNGGGDVDMVAELNELLGQSDIVSVHVPLNAETVRMFNRDRFCSMKKGSYFINTSRGGVVEEAALLKALEGGRLAGAALDVLTSEPDGISDRHPLISYAASHNNLLLTPHIGGATFESMERCELFMTDLLRKTVVRELNKSGDRIAST